MENLCSVLFEASNEDRLRILKQLNKKAMNVTNLSKTLGLTIQECSRHVSRLGEVGLTRKEVDGFYRHTFFGELVLKQLEGLEFTSKHRDYFSSHSTKYLPQEFLSRIGDLSQSRYVDDLSAAFYTVEKLLKEAEEYIWNTTAGIAPPSILPLLKEALERKVKIRNIDELGTRVIPQTREWIDTEDVQAMKLAFDRARIDGVLDDRVLERLDISLCISEKEVAGLGFPSRDGRFDYSGFTSKDERAHKWCEDLFQYYWERAESRSEVVERLYRWIKGKPEIVIALRRIAAGKELIHGEKLISELETKGLVTQGQITMIGLLLYHRLQ